MTRQELIKAAAWYNFAHEPIGPSLLDEIEVMDADE